MRLMSTPSLIGNTGPEDSLASSRMSILRSNTRMGRHLFISSFYSNEASRPKYSSMIPRFLCFSFLLVKGSTVHQSGSSGHESDII